MFSGIVEELGEVLSLQGDRLVVGSRVAAIDSPIGGSVAVNGVCLTVVERGEERLGFDLSEETRRRSTLGALEPGDPVNLERPVTFLTRLGGHLVLGHVDGIGKVEGIAAQGEGAHLEVRLPDGLERYVVEKGSIALDGVSLTIAAVEEGRIAVALIPHTLRVTSLGSLEVGDAVNVEVDVIAKHVERLLERVQR
ncbi:MAG: riboflavin synthase subunit alpha [Actinomycetota bacterium]|jgi:riboflavin synthase|nr:MAG: riboflavin synthase subunit alpha [Actinomycetota bacterium]